MFVFFVCKTGIFTFPENNFVIDLLVLRVLTKLAVLALQFLMRIFYKVMLTPCSYYDPDYKLDTEFPKGGDGRIRMSF